MGYETDTYTLTPGGTVLPSGSLFVPAAANNFAGTDFVRGVIRVQIATISGATALAIGLQTADSAGNWYPTGSSAAAVAAMQGGITFTPVAATNFASYPTVFPGNLFRLVAWATAGTVTLGALGITADFQKWVADSS